MGFNNWKKEPEQPENSNLLCNANGCPCEWTVENGGRLCSNHAWANPRDWQTITTKLRNQEMMGTLPTFAKTLAYQPPKTYGALSAQEKRDIALDLKGVLSSDHRGWAKKLKAREESGEHLSKYQADAWRQAMR